MHNPPDPKYVYHGSPMQFETAVPKRQLRSRKDEHGTYKVTFDEISFHATPYKWIALAYTYTSKPHKMRTKNAHYNMGVSLYENEEELGIYGFGSLEESLEKLYGDGGYLFTFKKEDFFTMEGLGDLEVITKAELVPHKIERIDDPLAELKQLGITFSFIDLAKPEHKNERNYY